MRVSESCKKCAEIKIIRAQNVKNRKTIDIVIGRDRLLHADADYKDCMRKLGKKTMDPYMSFLMGWTWADINNALGDE